MSGRLPRLALYAFVVGLAAHNLVMASLWDAGVRGAALDVVAAWKEALLALALAAVAWRHRGLPFKATATDWLALAYAAAVLLWALLPQGWLGGEATARGELYALRHHLLPVAAYFLGRGLLLGEDGRRRARLLVVGTAAAVSVAGLLDVWLVPLDWWRESGAPGWYREQLGLQYAGLSGLPENFVYNDGDEEPVRRLVSTFLSPLATAYLLLVAVLAVAGSRRPRLLAAAGALAFAGLLFTYSRTALAALAVALLVLAAVTRRGAIALGAVVVVVAGAAFVQAYPEFGPSTTYTPQELRIQREGAARAGDTSHDPFSADESSARSHLRNLRDGVEAVVRHPQGYGLGNAGVTAKRTDVPILAGESTYTELGVDAGLLTMLLFLAWSIALTRRVLRSAPWLGASLAAVLLLGVQTDVIGVPWLAYCLWALAGDRA